MRDGEVDADSPQPRAGRRRRLVTVARSERAHEGLLRQVLSRSGVEDYGADRAVDRGVLALIQLAKLRGGIELGALGHGRKCGPTATYLDWFMGLLIWRVAAQAVSRRVRSAVWLR